MKARDLLLRSRQIGLEADDPAKDDKETAEEKPEEKETPEAEETKETEESSEEEKTDEDTSDDESSEEESSDKEESDDTDETETEESTEPTDDSTDTATDDSGDAASDDASADSENAEGGEETTVPVEGEVESSIGNAEKEILDLNGFAISEAEASDAIDEVSTATEALESIYLSIERSLPTGGLTRDAYSFATGYANQVCKLVGLESVTTGLESTDTRLQMSVAAMESIKDKLAAGAKAIAEFFVKLYNAIAARLKKMKSSVVSVAKRISDKIQNLSSEMFSQPVEVRTSLLKINGNVTKDFLNDVEKSLENIKKFSALTIFDDYEKVQDSADDIIHKKLTLNDIYDRTRDLNTKTYAAVDKILRFNESREYAPTDHLAGKITTGMALRDSNGSPSDMFGLYHNHEEAVPTSISLSKLGLDKASAQSIMATANTLKLALEHYEAKAIRVQARTTAAMKSAQMYEKDVEFQDYFKATTGIQRSVAKLIRLGSDLCSSVIDAIYELNRAVDAASSK